MKTKKIVPMLILFSVLIVMPGLLLAGEVNRCIICGMDVSKYPHSRYRVTATNEEEFITCGAQCGLTLHLRFKEKFKSAAATDLLSNRPLDARKAFYVYKSSVITDMAPGFIVFAARKNAESFAKGFGGQVVDYDEALAIWKKQVQQ